MNMSRSGRMSLCCPLSRVVIEQKDGKCGKTGWEKY